MSKTVSLKKTPVGPSPIRESDVPHESFTERAPKLGGLIAFYRSSARVAWTPAGTNVPDYPKLAQLWWQNIGEAVAGEVTVDTAMDNLAREPGKVMARIARSGAQGDCGPKLNDEIDAKIWLARPGSPKAKLANEKPQGETVDCDRLLQAWREGRAAPSKAALICSPHKN